MLGFERKEPFVVKGKYAKRLCGQLYRIATGKYNRWDILTAAFQHEKHNIKIVAKNDDGSNCEVYMYEDLLAEQINDATSKYIVFVNPTVEFDYKTTYKGLKMKLMEGYLHANYKFENDEKYKTHYTFVICGTDKDKILNDSIEFFKKQYEDFEKSKNFVYIKLTEVDKRHDAYTNTDYTSVSYQMYVENEWNER